MNTFKNFIKGIVIGLIIGTIIILSILQYQNNNIVNNRLNELNSLIKSSERLTDYTLRGIEQEFKGKIDKLNKEVKDLPALERGKRILLEQTLKQVNVEIRNVTVGGLGSGATIKYKNNYYILSAGHLANEKTDILELWENGMKICDLEIIKYDYTNGEITTNSHDLLLLRPKNRNIQPRFYVELGHQEPLTGGQIYIVGNPMGIEDVVSQGRVVIYMNKFMYFRDSTYFGNSGGGLYNEDGNLIGIMSHISAQQPFSNFPPFVLEGAVRLSEILKFMENVS